MNVGETPLYVPNQSVVVGASAPKFRVNNNFVVQHSYSTDDASLGEYKYTVNVGQHSIKITGDNFELIRTAKLVLDDYFSSAEFLQSIGELDDSFNQSSYHHHHSGGGVIMSPDVASVAGNNTQIQGVVVERDDSRIALDKKASGSKTLIHEADEEAGYDDEVFIVDENGQEIPVGKTKVNEETTPALARSKKSNNLRVSNSPSEDSNIVVKKQGNNGSKYSAKKIHVESPLL